MKKLKKEKEELREIELDNIRDYIILLEERIKSLDERVEVLENFKSRAQEIVTAKYRWGIGGRWEKI